MTWLVKLYPPRWRQRYGAELAELVAARRFSIGVAADLVAGAIDAWLHPELAAATTAEARGEMSMVARMMHLECARYGPDVTQRDKVRSVVVMLGGTIALTSLWLWGVWQFRKNPYLMSLAPMAYFVPYLVGLRHVAEGTLAPRAGDPDRWSDGRAHGTPAAHRMDRYEDLIASLAPVPPWTAMRLVA